MDWKRFYADELAGPPGRAAALDAVARHAPGDDAVRAVLQAGGLASFPHVSIHDSAEPIARVVQSILEIGAPRVVALGVLHHGTLPQACRAAQAALTPEDAFQQFGGAFVARGAVATPFGSIDDGAVPARAACIHDDAAILAHEFSLDLFLALLAAAADVRGVRPPAVTRLFVSATRSPAGSFDIAAALADVIRSMIDSDTVCVATGDLVHIGHGYTPAAEMDAVPADAAALHAALLPQLHAMHDAAMARHDFATAWNLGTALRSDQRHLLPVFAALLGPGATAKLLSFRLSDYAHINGMPPPCFVGAALSLFSPARTGDI